MVHILYDVLTIYILASSLPDQSKAITFFALKVHIRHLHLNYFLYGIKVKMMLSLMDLYKYQNKTNIF